jgi:[protein-PII] uridylyltransferase
MPSRPPPTPSAARVTVSPVPATEDPPDPPPLKGALAVLLEDRNLTGSEWCRAYAAAADAWLRDIFQQATAGDENGVTLLAVGGYGRGELAPFSDLDLVLVYDRRGRINPIADAVWYPIWDAGVRLDHSVRTAKEVRTAMDGDIKVALGLLDGRRVAGDERLAESVLTRGLDQWRTRASRWLPTVDELTRQRHERFGDLASLLEPDLKEARGGLRDLHQLRSLGQVVPVLTGVLEDPGLSQAAESLVAARVDLHRNTGRATNLLLLQDQDAVAASLGYDDADALMLALADAGRSLSWVNDDGWRRLESWLAGPVGRGGGRDRPLEPGLVLRDGEVTLLADAPLSSDTSLALRTAAASAELDRPMARTTLDRLATDAVAPNGTWPPDTRQALLRLLGAGRPAVAAIESLDQLGVWLRYLPEWAPIRNKPQRNAYHRFTVDRHLLETAAGAASMVGRVARPDLLLLGALLHDIGKGRGGDHTEIGIAVVRELAPRLGLDEGDTATLQTLVRYHLLLPEVATRRDLDDPATAGGVAAAVGDRGTLYLLGALTEADSLATGPSAWGPWKAGLVGRLVDLTAATLEGRPPVDARAAALGPEQQALLAAGRLQILADGGRIVVVAPDRPGLLATVAGVLTLAGTTVRSATTVSDPATAMALLRFDVTPTFDSLPEWGDVTGQLQAALEARIALPALLEERERQYARYRRASAAAPAEARVIIDNGASAASTVVEVRAPDRGAVLYRLAKALADSGLTITSALVTTMGAGVIDVFYVQDASGERLADPQALARLAATVESAL